MRGFYVEKNIHLFLLAKLSKKVVIIKEPIKLAIIVTMIFPYSWTNEQSVGLYKNNIKTKSANNDILKPF